MRVPPRVKTSLRIILKDKSLYAHQDQENSITFPGNYGEHGGISLAGETMTIQKPSTEKEKMLAGELYFAYDPELTRDREQARELLWQANRENDQKLLHQLFAEAGEGSFVQLPFYCDYGFNIHLGKRVFFNFNCVLLDVLPIRIGDGCQIGPAVQIYTADHPRDASLRAQDLELGQPVTIGRNVWIGGGAIILPGVTIGDNAIIGAGSVVTRDVAPATTVKGNPARAK